MRQEREVFPESSKIPRLLKILVVLGSEEWGREQEVGSAAERVGGQRLVDKPCALEG